MPRKTALTPHSRYMEPGRLHLCRNIDCPQMSQDTDTGVGLRT